jgi:hypothetical protein
MKSKLYISVRNWRKFQHYDPEKRTPPWIKNYTELMSSDAYLNLAAGPRAVLHGIWLEYASSQCELSLDTVSLTRRLNLRVTRDHLELLNQAGFLDFVASKALAEGYRGASARARATETEVETEGEVEKENPPTPPVVRGAGENGWVGDEHQGDPLVPDLLKEIPW